MIQNLNFQIATLQWGNSESQTESTVSTLKSDSHPENQWQELRQAGDEGMKFCTNDKT